MEKKMMKRLAVSGIVSISLAFALMAGGCGKSEEKTEVPSKTETVTEHAVTEHAPTMEKTEEEADTSIKETAIEAEGHAAEAPHETEAHEPVKKKMLEGC